MKLMPDRRRIRTNLIFLEYRFKKYGKQKTEVIIPAPIISASSILIKLSFFVNIDVDFMRKAFSQ